MKYSQLLIFLLLQLVLSATSFANNPGISYQGRIFKPDGNPLEGTTVQFRMQVRSPGSENCLLYEEVQTLNMAGSAGVFALTLNDGTGTRLDAATYQVDRIFANRDTMTLDTTRCTAGTTYTPNSADGRKLVVYFKDETMTAYEAMPLMNLNYVPQAMYALEAQKVDKFAVSNILRAVDGSGNPVAAPALNPTQLVNLNTLLATPAANYVQTTTNGSAALPVVAGNPSSGLAAGQIWYDSGSNVMKYYDGAVKTFGTSGGGVTSVATGTGLTGGPITTTGTINVDVGVTTGKIIQVAASNKLPVIDGSNLTNITATDATKLPLAGGTMTGPLVNNSNSASTALAVTQAGAGYAASFMGGNVGIGTASPTTTLDINGGMTYGGSTAAGTPPVAAQGKIYFDSTANKFKVSENNGAYVDLVNGTAGGSLTGNYPNPTIAALAITNTEISNTAAIADSKLATISTAGKVSGSAISSGIISGNTVINTSGNIQTSGTVRLYDGGPTNYVGLKAPASVTTNYDLLFPAAKPSVSGYLLAGDTSGNLSWVAPNSGSVTSVTATPPVASTGGATPVISMTQANTTTAGYISNTDWNTFNNKLGTTLTSANILVGNGSNVATAVAPGGDVTMTNAGSFTVTKIQGSTVSSAIPPSSGQILRFTGTQWAPNYISMFDLRSTITGATSFAAGCTSGQTLTWTSATDNLSCTNIAINDSQISNTVSRTANTFLAAPDGSAGAASYRGLASADLPSISSGMTGTLPATNGGTGQSSYTVGDLLYASSTTALSKLPASTSGHVLTSGGAGVAPSWAVIPSNSISGLTAATATNALNNANYAQTWNWNSATTENPMTLTANALTTGSLLNLTTSSASINPTNGLLNVANSTATTTGTLARFQSNSTAGSGMTILNSGNVGIGTSSPDGKLDVRGNLNAGTSNTLGANAGLTLGRANSASGYDAVAAGFSNTASGNQSLALGQNNSATNVGSVALGRLNISSGTGSAAFGNNTTATAYGSFTLGRYNVGGGNSGSWVATDPLFEIGIGTGTDTSAANALTVLKNGNVGIGTAAPGYPFHVYSNSTGLSQMVLENPNTGVSAVAGVSATTNAGSAVLGMRSTAAGAYAYTSSGGSGGVEIQAYNAAGVIKFKTGGFTERVRIDSSGNVGIGTTGPSTKLHVLGSSGATIATFADGGATTCTVTPASTGFACSSDERLKKNIETYSDSSSLENILKLRTVTYDWRSVDNGRHTGYIAQELEQVAPEFVRTGEDGFKQVNYTGLVPWITGAIKAFHAEFKTSEENKSREIASVKAENAAIKQKNAELKARLDQQEKELAAIKNKLGL